MKIEIDELEIFNELTSDQIYEIVSEDKDLLSDLVALELDNCLQMLGKNEPDDEEDQSELYRAVRMVWQYYKRPQTEYQKKLGER